MEKPKVSEMTREEFHERLKEEEHIKRVEPGLEINTSDYSVGALEEGIDELFIEDTRDALVRYLGYSLVVDDFKQHEDRIAWYNQKGLGNKAYLDNKLRLNKLLGALMASEIYTDCVARYTEEKESSFAPTAKSLLAGLEGYGEFDIEKKLELIAETDDLTKGIINEMIDFGWLVGKKLN